VNLPDHIIGSVMMYADAVARRSPGWLLYPITVVAWITAISTAVVPMLYLFWRRAAYHILSIHS
jgi:hypothetical protein